MNILMAIVVLLNGQPIEFKQAKPFMQNNVLMVPLREVAQEMKTTASYTSWKSIIVGSSKNGSRRLAMHPGSRRAFISRRRVYSANARATAPEKPITILLDASPQLKDGRAFVPIRFAEVFGNQVLWDKSKKTARIFIMPVPKPKQKSNSQSTPN